MDKYQDMNSAEEIEYRMLLLMIIENAKVLKSMNEKGEDHYE